MNGRRQTQTGFTLAEILVVMVVALALVSLSLVNLGRPQETANSSTLIDTLLADLKSQQILAMSGGTGGTTAAQPQGVYIQSSRFTLFAGGSYNAGDPHNFTENAPGGIRLSTAFPGSSVIFQKGTGEVQGFSGGSNTITVSTANTTKTVTINRFGTATVQ